MQVRTTCDVQYSDGTFKNGRTGRIVAPSVVYGRNKMEANSEFLSEFLDTFTNACYETGEIAVKFDNDDKDWRYIQFWTLEEVK